MWVILFTAKLLIINFTNSKIGQAFTEGCKKKNALTKGHFGQRGRCSSMQLFNCFSNLFGRGYLH